MNTPPTRKLLDQVRDVLRLKHYSIRTEEAYVDWIKRFILFHGKRHPQFLRQRQSYAVHPLLEAMLPIPNPSGRLALSVRYSR